MGRTRLQGGSAGSGSFPVWPVFHNSFCCLVLLQIGANMAKKYDEGKLPYHLLPMECIDELVKVLGMGAAKYGENSWKWIDKFDERYFSACMRHLSAWRQGEETDSESGLSHLTHALCNVTFLLAHEIYLRKGREDDLP